MLGADTKRLRHLADFLDDQGIGVGDHSDSPFLREVADALDRARATIAAVHAAIRDGRLMNYVPPDGPTGDATVSLAECVTAAVAEIERRRQLYLDEVRRGTAAAESVTKIGTQCERLLADRDRLRAALELLAQGRHVSGSAQGTFRTHLRLVDAVLAGADVRDADTVEAIAAGRWKGVAG